MAGQCSAAGDAQPADGSAPSEPVYDAFVSYARADERLSRFLGPFAESARTAFRAVTGRDLRLFIDVEDIVTSERHRDRLLAALDASSAMIALLTPSYVTSEWCNREWTRFTTREQAGAGGAGQPAPEAIVFPLALRTLEGLANPSPQMLRLMHEMAARQQISFEDVEPGSDLFRALVMRLVTDLATMLDRTTASASQAVPPDDRRNPPGLDHPYVTTYYGDGPFLARLAEAVSVTIIGTTNDGLVDQLETALAEKRRREGDDAFWESLRVVFFGDDLLPFVNDELVAESTDPAYALRERARRAGYAKRTVMALLLREGPRSRWTLYSYAYLPPFQGALFGMSDGSLVVQIRAPHPASAETESLWLEVDDRRDRYFSTAFAAVREASREEHEVVLVGEPTPEGFRCTTARFRRGVMISDQHNDDWLPAVIAVTWRAAPSGPQPLLQVNTPRTSTREIGTVSHPSGYINQQDHAAPDGPPHTSFDLPLTTAEAAVWRELHTSFGLGREGHYLLSHGTLDFYYHDKENFSFYLFSVELDPRRRFSSAMQMYSWDIDELLAIRHHQVITKALAVLGAIDLSPRQRTTAGEIVAHNLVLHGEDALAEQVRVDLDGDGDGTDLIQMLQRRASELQVVRHLAGTEVAIDGLAGLQFRAFFSHILPIYAAIGSRRAAEVLEEVDRRAATRAALADLASSYDDEAVMTSLPIDL